MRVYYINFVSFILFNNPVRFFFVCAVSTELKKYCILNGINAFFNENLRLPHPSSSLQPYILTTLHKVLNSFVHNILFVLPTYQISYQSDNIIAEK